MGEKQVGIHVCAVCNLDSDDRLEAVPPEKDPWLVVCGGDEDVLSVSRALYVCEERNGAGMCVLRVDESEGGDGKHAYGPACACDDHSAADVALLAVWGGHLHLYTGGRRVACLVGV